MSTPQSSPPVSKRFPAVISPRSIRLAGILALASFPASYFVNAQSSLSPQTAYTITDLGVLPGGGLGCPCADPLSINISGQATGLGFTPDGENHAVLFSMGTVTQMDASNGAVSSIGFGINGFAQVAGTFLSSDNYRYRAFLYSAGKMMDIGTLPGENQSDGRAINDSGQITGNSSSTSNNFQYAFLYTAGTMTNLGALPGATISSGEGINSSAQVAGFSGNQAVLFANGSVRSLGKIPGWVASEATAINDFGQITGVGYSGTGGTYQESSAFLYSSGKLTQLGTIPGFTGSSGASINNLGQVVGTADPPNGGNYHAFLYTPGRGMIDLNSLLPANSGWQYLDSANSINDLGQITGQGLTREGFQRAYLLSPVRVQFSTLDAVVQIDGSPRNTFIAGGRFTLGAKSNGINSMTEAVILQLGNYHITIPPSLFTQLNGTYLYHGTIGTVDLVAAIRPVASNTFLFAFYGRGAAPAALPHYYPLALTLTIGNDTGTEQVTAPYSGPIPNEAAVCQLFHMTC